MGSAAYVVRNAGDSLSLSFKLLYFGEGGGPLECGICNASSGGVCSSFFEIEK